jgi:hypothetical protein
MCIMCYLLFLTWDSNPKLSNNSETEEITMVCITMALDLKAKKLGLVRPIR